MDELRLPLRTRSAGDTRAVGAAIGSLLRPGDAIALAGDLGAGKTTLVQGLASALGYAGHVASPTFTLVREYAASLRLRHVDVYRLERVQDVLDLGLDDDPDAVVAVEWGDAVEGLLPTDHLTIDLRTEDDAGADAPVDAEVRRIALRAPRSSTWAARWDELALRTDAWRDAR